MNASQGAPRRSLTAQFGLVGAGLGLLTGLFEAAFLYFKPRIPVLFQPDVGYGIWFLAPLVDELLFGFVGLALGFAADLQRHRAPQRAALLASIGCGAAAAFFIDETLWVHMRMAGHLSKTWRILCGVAVLLAVAGVIHRAFQHSRNRGAGRTQPGGGWSFEPLAKGVGIATGLLIASLAFYLMRPAALLPSPRSSPVLRAHEPNIVLISLDTVRASHIHSYGYTRPTTPNLDLAARRGVLFENAIAPSSWTLASHASIFTGLLPHQHGADFNAPLAGGLLTVARALKARGYQTAGFTSNYDYGYSGWGMAQGFDTYDDDSFSPRHNLLLVPAAQRFRQLFFPPVVSYDQFGRRDAAELNRDVIRWLRGHLGRPFFLFINYFDAHDPYLAPAPYDRYFGSVSHGLVRRLSPIMNWQSLSQPLSAGEQEMLLAGYDNCLAYLDDQVGKLLRLLIESPDWPNTIVIITADHGEAFGEHGGYYGHGWGLGWDLLHVPLIVAGRDVPAGLRISSVVGTSDLYFTVLAEAAGRGGFSSRSLGHFWGSERQAQSPGGPILSELAPIPEAVDLRAASASMVTQEWHYIQDAEGGCQMYHWPTDPEERHDFSQSPQYEGVRLALRQQLQRAFETSSRPWLGVSYIRAVARRPEWSADCVARPNRRPSKEEEELLRNLPYH